MFKLNSKNGEVIVYAETIEQDAISQVLNMANSPLGENADIRIMPDCLPRFTDVLTAKGFKHIEEITKDDKIANYNPQTKEIFFANPKAIIKRALRKDEIMYKFSCKQSSFAMYGTENHRFLFQNKEFLAKNIPDVTRLSDYTFFGYLQNDYCTSYSDLEIQIIVWIVGDGAITDNGNGTLRVKFAIKKERKIKRLTYLLDQYGCKYTKYIDKRNGATAIELNVEYSKCFVKLLDNSKRIPLNFMFLDQRQTALFFDELIQVDGDYENYTHLHSYRFNSSQKREVDIVQAICCLHGKYSKTAERASYSSFTYSDKVGYYLNKIESDKVEHNKNGFHNRKIIKSVFPYNDDVFCLECDTSYFVVRQEGVAYVTGNCHAGAGCVIGTTMKITDKVCANLVGVDLGCGVNFVKTDIDFGSRFEELDAVIRKNIPYGMEIHEKEVRFSKLSELYCWNKLSKEVQERAKRAMGTLGGGNHFIEAYENGGLSVHSGSRNIGKAVATYYQKLAEKRISEYNHKCIHEEMLKIEPAKREEWLKSHKVAVATDLSYLTGQDMQDYLHDVAIMQEFANQNRFTILNTIVTAMGGKILEHIESVHNYIDLSDKDNIILRKGAISAKKGEILVIPLNMRDGILICEGKGNPEWNFSAPHGAGRLYSRSKAKELFSVEDFSKTMEGIFSTCINESTIDESPFAYKDYKEIMNCIEPTVEIKERIVPIYNFKAN